MKFTWIEETIATEVDVLDPETGLPVDPPELVWKDVGTGMGQVTGLNRGVDGEGEKEGDITPQHLVYGMDVDMYHVVDNVFTPKVQNDVDTIKNQREAEKQEIKRLDDLEKGFKTDAYAPVDAEGYTWSGGLESAMMLDFGIRLAEKLSETTVSLYDINDDLVELPLDRANNVVIAVGTSYRTPYTKYKKDKKVE